MKFGLQSRPVRELGPVHFVGIGGVGMSGIAEIMVKLGWQVQGSDLVESTATRRLRMLQVKVFIGHRAENMIGCAVLVISSAVPGTNVEIREAQKRRVPIIKRAEMLAEIMRLRFGIAVAGTHGKTTTTSLISAVLYEVGLDPTYVTGGRIEHLGTNASIGESQYLVVEADESDASFLHLYPMISVVTNIDDDHLDHYENDPDRLHGAFEVFLNNLPFYGMAAICGDDKGLVALKNRVARRFVTYGFNAGNDLCARRVVPCGTRMQCLVDLPWRDSSLKLSLNFPGAHNVLNALATFATCHELEVSDNDIVGVLETFQGISRRFQRYGKFFYAGRQGELVDDYAHHPTEIVATLEAARGVWPDRRIVLIFQPHRYTRTALLFDKFVEVLAKVDALLLMPVYPAGEEPLAGADSVALQRSLRENGFSQTLLVDTVEEVPQALYGMLQDGDIVLTMGAGTVAQLPRRIVAGDGAEV